MEEETKRTAVQTYIPSYQKDLWADDADRMGVSQSEFIRMMVQAGRSELELSSSRESEKHPTGDTQSSSAHNGDVFRDRVLETLSPDRPQNWDELVDALTEELEKELDQTLEKLQQDNVIRYSGRQGGYIIREGYDE